MNNNHSQTIELEKFDDGYFVDNVVPDYVYILSAVYMAIIFTIGFVANISIFIIFGTTSSPAVSTCTPVWQLQGVQGQIFMFQLALRDRNMQVRFGLKVFWESWIAEFLLMTLQFG